MASSTSSGQSTSDEYQNQKKNVMFKLKNNQLDAVDLYNLASLLASWASNESLPVCLLCQTEKARNNGFGLGHLIPHSILKESGLKSFVHVNQGKESGPSNMGYKAFCSGCEQRFSHLGEVNFNPKLFKLFHEKQNELIEANVCDSDGNSWLYFCLVSIVWRCLCFVPSCQIYLEILEYLRSFLLSYPDLDPKVRDIDSRVTFYVFAPNSELESKCQEDNEAYKRYFDQMYTATFKNFINDSNINEIIVAAWIFMGPIHILMTYKSIVYVNADIPMQLLFGMSKEDFDAAKQSCVFKRTDEKIVINNKQDRFFPMSVYPTVVQFGNDAMSQTTRIPPPKNVALASSVIQASKLFLLPKDVECDKDTGFKLPPKRFKETFRHSPKEFKGNIVGARRGRSEKIVFVCFQEAIKYSGPNGEPMHGPLAMALNIDDHGKVSYLEDVHIPTIDKCDGQDLNQIPYREDIEKIINALRKDGIAMW